ncbi:short-chain fatty acyl-CoA regulator family protein [Jannaschia donghaensis]|uniref:Putative transcriptional regulator n=1 Tax=Jannaschia donghaensis TaxID=420998 RepID=A0A0M6YEJ4_9RHOB|nr:short-chain fatty acyl-CoA regulator family protein [Jannaschia donghaensis]CTQ48748.1 putative transcriptional regulator [Jannaschia donghaensis]
MPRSIPTGRRIRERRLSLGLKQAALATTVGISPSYLNLIEHNRRAIGGALLTRLAEALGSDRAALAEGGDSALIEAVQAAGAAGGVAEGPLADAATLAQQHPAWARLIEAQAEAMAAQARTIEALSDRLSHDPTLAEAMHELLSTVSVVRSTASILAQTPEIDANWRGRFHANLDADSRRLADGVEAVMELFDGRATDGGERLLPSEVVSRFLDDAGHRFPALEELGTSAIAPLVAGLADPQARALAADILRGDAEDAARLPREVVEAASGPDDLIAAAGGDLALVLRRLGTVDPGRGLVVCDAAGALLRRKPVAGFALPVMGAGCPLWPIFGALARPGHPISTVIETPDGAVWRVHAVAQAAVPTGFRDVPVLRATMLLTRADGTGDAMPVGPGCRVCPRPACAARREPSILTGGVALDMAPVTEDT